MHPDWARSARDFCAANDIPFFFKQWGGVRKTKGDYVLDGQTHLEYPPLQYDRQSLPEYA
jgi:protein gp37